ncbi:MAG TPA: carboxypeptidase-like regulatory domain-containing protein, partial [Planctomycetota bacterium]|nr:carboxypeptidase-like regulatory domain-containing protein [Planctomycetota bacterium]
AESDAEGRFDLPVAAAPDAARLHVAWIGTARILEDGLENEAPLGNLVDADVELQRADFTSGVPRRIELDTGWMIGGTVTDGRGQPVHAARLFVEKAGCTAESGRDGAFLLRDIPADQGSADVFARAPGRQTRSVTVSAPPAGQDRATALIELPECASLRGAVVDESGVPFEDVEVFLVGAAEVAPGPFDTRTGRDGDFAFDGLPEGRYDLVARVDDEHAQRAGAPDAAAETWAHDVLLACGANRDVRLVVAKGVSQRGRVLDNQGRPLGNHVVAARVVRAIPCHPAALCAAASAETDTAGRFALRRLAPGPWELTVEGIPAGCEHGDGGQWRPLASRGAPGALAQDGAPAGPPRPVELRREVEVGHVPDDVELVVPRVSEHPEWSLQSWPWLRARLSSGRSYPLFEGARIEIWDVARRAVAHPQYRFADISMPVDSETAAGLLVFAAPGYMPRFTVLHDAQLEHDFGEVVLDEAPKVVVGVRDEAGKWLGDPEITIHWFGGGRPEAVASTSDGTLSPLSADRREGRFEVTVSAPGRRRWRKAGLVPPPSQPASFDVVLPIW